MAGSATEDLLSFADDMLKGLDCDEATRAATLKTLLEPSPEPDRAASSAVGCQALPTTPVQVLPRTPQSPTEPPSPAAEPVGGCMQPPNDAASAAEGGQKGQEHDKEKQNTHKSQFLLRA